jgi:hypothetical protein
MSRKKEKPNGIDTIIKTEAHKKRIITMSKKQKKGEAHYKFARNGNIYNEDNYK